MKRTKKRGIRIAEALTPTETQLGRVPIAEFPVRNGPAKRRSQSKRIKAAESWWAD